MFWALAVLAVSMCSPRALGSGCWTDRQPEVGVCQGFAPDFCFSEHHAGKWSVLHARTAWGTHVKIPSWLVQDTRWGQTPGGSREGWGG